jgi:hypothetical protein
VLTNFKTQKQVVMKWGEELANICELSRSTPTKGSIGKLEKNVKQQHEPHQLQAQYTQHLQLESQAQKLGGPNEDLPPKLNIVSLNASSLQDNDRTFELESRDPRTNNAKEETNASH